MHNIFQVLAFPVLKLRVDITPQLYKIPPQMLLESKEYWEKHAGPGLYNGTLARLKTWKLLGTELYLELELTNYRTQFYSNQHIERILDYWGVNSLSCALGISAIVETRDHAVLFMKRSHEVGEFPGFFDVFGGHIEVCAEDNTIPTVYEAMYSELEEELGVKKSEMELEPLGLIKSIPNLKPELAFHCRLALTEKEAYERAKNAVDQFEYDHLLSVPYPFDGLKFSPSAVGCLSLFKSKHQEG